MLKRIFYVVVVFAIISCSNNQQQIDKLTFERDSIAAAAMKKDSAVTIFFQAMNEIEANLQTIKEKEGIIGLNKGVEVSVDQKDQINKDILSIYELLNSNRKKLKRVQNKLYNSGLRIEELNKTIEKLNTRLAQKDSNIAHLRMQLSNMDLLVDSLFQNIDSLYFENELKDEIIDYQRSQLNKAYYIVGSKKELLEQNVIDKKGGFVGLKRIKQLRSDFNKDNFTEIDVTQINSIPLFAENAELITTHPSESYQLFGDKKADSLVITDIQEFWSVSKYLVIVIE